MRMDDHWLQQFYKEWTMADLESRLNELMFSTNVTREIAQLQAEMERRERDQANEPTN